MNHLKNNGRILLFAVAALLEGFLAIKSLREGDTATMIFYALASGMFTACLIIAIDNRRIQRRADRIAKEPPEAIRGYLPPLHDRGGEQ